MVGSTNNLLNTKLFGLMPMEQKINREGATWKPITLQGREVVQLCLDPIQVVLMYLFT